MTWLEIQRDFKKTELDRGTWAELDKIAFDIIVRGTGEYLMEEPIWFGRPFEEPPFFTYSAVFRRFPGIEAVRAVSLPNEGVSPVASTRGNHLWQDHFFPDGSFEHQMIWGDPVIPHWATSYPRFQKIDSEQTGTSPWLTDYDNLWVQEPAKQQWSVSSDVSYSVPFGYQGSYSAKYVFGADPSPALVPFAPWESQPVPLYDGGPPERGIWSHRFQSQRDDDVVYQAPAWNPRQGEFRYVVHAFSEDSFMLEVTAVPFLVANGDYFPIEGKSEDFLVEGGAWKELVFDWSVPFEYEPNFPFAGKFPEGVFDPGYVRVEFRVKDGSPGQAVYLDEIWGQPRLRPTALPLITIGVAEWVRDEYDMYVGAILWFKVSFQDFIPSVLPPPTVST